MFADERPFLQALPLEPFPQYQNRMRTDNRKRGFLAALPGTF